MDDMKHVSNITLNSSEERKRKITLANPNPNPYLI